jgi:hypothetical protein
MAPRNSKTTAAIAKGPLNCGSKPVAKAITTISNRASAVNTFPNLQPRGELCNLALTALLSSVHLAVGSAAAGRASLRAPRQGTRPVRACRVSAADHFCGLTSLARSGKLPAAHRYRHSDCTRTACPARHIGTRSDDRPRPIGVCLTNPSGIAASRAGHDDHRCGRTMSFFCSCGFVISNCSIAVALAACSSAA